jgi:hypothetical protein
LSGYVCHSALGITRVVALAGDVDMTPKFFESIGCIPHQRTNLIETQCRYTCIYDMPCNFAKNFYPHAPEWSDERLMVQSLLLQCKSQSIIWRSHIMLHELFSIIYRIRPQGPISETKPSVGYISLTATTTLKPHQDMVSSSLNKWI